MVFRTMLYSETGNVLTFSRQIQQRFKPSQVSRGSLTENL